MVIDQECLKRMFHSAAQILQEQSGTLSEIDSRFGDGDHGVTIGKIAKAMESAVTNWGQESIHDFIDDLGTSIMGVNGGSAGPLYGTMISGLAEGMADEETIDGPLLKKMLLTSRDSMYEITKARIGDKTMMDALIPAVDAAQSSDGEPPEILNAAAEAAKAGAKASEAFVSKFGRAKSYKEETIGTPDAGAVSTSLFFEGLSKGIA